MNNFLNLGRFFRIREKLWQAAKKTVDKETASGYKSPPVLLSGTGEPAESRMFFRKKVLDKKIKDGYLAISSCGAKEC
jgi:hypothetical protein